MKTYFKITFLVSFLTFCFINISWSQANQKEYLSVEIFTGEEVNAGSNMRPSLTLLGYNNSESVKTIIWFTTKYIDGNALERNTVDKFNYLAPAFTSLEKIIIHSYDESIFQSSWYAKKIIIKLSNGNEYLFSCNCKIHPGGYDHEVFAKQLNRHNSK